MNTLTTANHYVLDYQGKLAQEIVNACNDDKRLKQKERTSVGPLFLFMDDSKLLLRCKGGFFLRLEAL